MDPYHPNMMSKFKANAFGLASSLSKALESVGSKATTKDDQGSSSGGGRTAMLNNNPANDPLSNYHYSPLNGHDARTGSSSPSHSKYDTDYTPRCMRPKSQSFQEVVEETSDHSEYSSVSPPVLTSSTNPFLPSASKYSTKQFIYNDLYVTAPTPTTISMPKSKNLEDDDGFMGQEMQEIKSNRNKREYLETDFEGDAVDNVKSSYKPANLGIPMVGMVPNAELVKINTHSPGSPLPMQELHPVAAIHPSKAVPLSSIFGVSVPIINQQPTTSPQIGSSITTTSVPLATPPQSLPLLEVNPNSKSTDIF